MENKDAIEAEGNEEKNPSEDIVIAYQKGLRAGWLDCLECVKTVMKGKGVFTYKKLMSEIEKALKWKA